MRKIGFTVTALGLALLLTLTTACTAAIIGEEEGVGSTTATGEEEEEDSTSETVVEEGTIEIRVTDPPPPGVKTANVTLTKIEVHKSVTEQEMEQGQSDDDDQVPEQDEGKWIIIIENEVTFNLFEIIEEAEILGSDVVTAGKYTQIRMEVVQVEGLTSDDTPYTATVPSGILKIVRPFEVKDGGTTILTVDFDGDKSLVETGKGKFLFKPVVRLQVGQSGSVDEEGGNNPPEISLSGVSNDEVIVSPGTVTPVFSVTDDTDLDPVLEATLNGEPFTSGTEIGEVGEYELELRATDTSDNESEIKVEFEIVAE